MEAKIIFLYHPLDSGILISILSEINNIKTKQQLQNERYKAEERLKDSK